MSKQQKPPNNNCLQMLRDLITELGESNLIDMQAKAIKFHNDLMNEQDTLRATQNASDRYDRRQYNNIFFSRLSIPNVPCSSSDDKTGMEPAILQSVSAAACKLFILFSTWAKSQYVQVSIDTLKKLSGMSENTVRDALHELLKKNLLSVARDPKQHDPAIYRLSAAIVKSGKAYGEEKDCTVMSNLLSASIISRALVYKPELEIVTNHTLNILGHRYVKVSATEWAENEESGSETNTAATRPLIQKSLPKPDYNTFADCKQEQVLTDEENALFER